MKTEEQVKEKMNEVARDLETINKNEKEEIAIEELVLKTLMWVLD